jgi:hypothetical protein
MNDEPKAEKSLCWTCKFGLCVQETERERFVHPGPQGEPDGDVFGAPFNEPEGLDIVEHTIVHERVKTVCFWKPEGVTQSPPILVAVVSKCNRFAK